MLSVIWNLDILSPDLNFNSLILHLYSIFCQFINSKKLRDVETQEFQFLSTTLFPFKSFLLLSIYFLEQFLGSQENWEEGTEISHIPLS